jgi:hypothetical protein
MVMVVKRPQWRSGSEELLLDDEPSTMDTNEEERCDWKYVWGEIV